MLASTGCGRKPPAPEEAAKATLSLTDFQPRSMLVVPETRIGRAKFPVIDVHSHIYGIGLPDGILKKVYHNNAARLLGLKQI